MRDRSYEQWDTVKWNFWGSTFEWIKGFMTELLQLKSRTESGYCFNYVDSEKLLHPSLDTGIDLTSRLVAKTDDFQKKLYLILKIYFLSPNSHKRVRGEGKGGGELKKNQDFQKKLFLFNFKKYLSPRNSHTKVTWREEGEGEERGIRDRSHEQRKKKFNGVFGKQHLNGSKASESRFCN